MEYMVNGGDVLIDEVIEERRLKRAKNNEKSSMFEGLRSLSQKAKDISTIAKNTSDKIYSKIENIGELAADTKLAYDYWKKMRKTGNQIVNTLGSGQGADIDNYYHPLLQCELAKISPQSRENGIALGYAKEYLMDYPFKKIIKKQKHDVIMEDSRKDLKNNLYGSNLGRDNLDKSCEELLDDRRTKNMKKLGIR